MRSRTATAIAIAHLTLAAAHGVAHVGLAVYESPLRTAYVLAVVHAAPIAAVVLLARGRTRAGLATLELALLGSFAYGTWAHFVAVSHDHVAHLPAGALRPLFQVTAALLSLVDGLGALVVLAVARRALLAGGRHVVLVDGTCVFCNRLVARLLRADREGRFRFAHLQSAFGRDALARHGADPDDVDGVYVLVDAGTPRERLLVDGAAGRQIWPRLHPVATPLLLLPAWLLDPYYALFARYRYRLFGQADHCIVPGPEERARFLGDAPDATAVGA